MNVLFILLDDLGWNDIGIHNEKIKTPNIDAIANEGCELVQNYTFPVCGPTRAMIHTGLYAYKYGMQKLFDPWVDYGLDTNIKILPEYLKEIEYSTYIIGKWHLGHSQRKFLPHKRGYDYHYGNLTGCINHVRYKHCNPVLEAQLHDFVLNGKAFYPKGHACEVLTNNCLKIIENEKNKFFIYLAYLSPHVPLIAPDKFKSHYDEFSEPKKSYLGMISQLDFEIGRIFKKLKDKNLYEETLIWIMSDNGGWNLDWACGDNFPLKQGKASFYQGGVRTLSVIKSNRIKSKKIEKFVHCVDVLPTILDFCGYKNEVNLDGISLFDDNKFSKRNIVLGFYGPNHWCFIIDNFKFIKLKKNSNHHLGVKDGKLEEEDIKYMECYDVLNDPHELNNLISEKYYFMKDKINEQINICLKDRVYENFEKYSQEEISNICSKLKFWGQSSKKNIKICSNDFEENSKQYINSKSNLLELTGYDIFYK
jgi:arylsulfatase A-like enzyme